MVGEQRRFTGQINQNEPSEQQQMAFLQQLRLNKNFKNNYDEEEEEPRHRVDSATTEQLYKVYDTEEGKYIDVRDLEKDICVLDSTTYINKRNVQKFTVLGSKVRFRTLWSDFWAKKDKTNVKLIKAAGKGDTKTMTKLLNKLRDAEKSADLNFCDD